VITRIRYFSIGVRDPAEGVITYQKRFGLVQATPLNNTRWGFRNTMMGNGVENVIEMISPVSPESALARFMEERVHPELNPKGEGPYLLGVEVDDLDAVVKRIEASGGKVNREADSPNTAWPHPTATCMTFFELHQAGTSRPAGDTPVAGPTIRGIRSVSIAVKDLEGSLETLKTRLGLEQTSDIAPFGNFGFRRVSLGYQGKNVVTLNSPTDEASSMARLMRQRSGPRNPHGEGIYQIVVATDSVEKMAEQVQANGGRINRNPGSNAAWPHPLDTHMVLMELQNAE
jgi:predicted enzyme related to lactoylglutathione lyase